MDSSQYESMSMVMYMYLFFMFTVNNMFFVLLYNGLNKEIVRVTADYNYIKDTLDFLASEYDSSDSESESCDSESDSGSDSDTDSDTDSCSSDSDDSIENITNSKVSETQTDDHVTSMFNWSYTYK
jgi:hypothetical protein